MGEILGIGIEELVFIGILLALLFGPESIPRFARSAGKALNRLFRSPLYKEGQHIRKQIQDLPTALARLAQLEEMQKSLHSEISDLKAQIDPGLDKVSESIASVTRRQVQAAASDLKSESSAAASGEQPKPDMPPGPAALDATTPPASSIAPPAEPTRHPRPHDADG
jgi:sec-independent protein translocase protein TatB